jgi:NAD-dependent DNA ligase
VTKRLGVLVCADVASQSGKTKKARDYGIGIISEAAFLRLIGAS